MFSTEKTVKPLRPSHNPVENVGDVRAHLSFSSVKSPLTNKRPLMNHNFQNMLAASSSSSSSPSLTSPNYHHRHRDYLHKIGEYHMSRQNPDILDRMYAKATPTPRHMLGSGKVQNELAAPISHTPKTHESDDPGAYSSPVSVESPQQMSLLRRMLNARKLQASSPGSIIQLAIQGGKSRRPKRAGLLRSSVASPVMVPVGGLRKPRQEEVKSDNEGGNDDVGTEKGKRDPCSKETVLDALRKKRKRFATPSSETEPEVCVDASSPAATPSAKRFKSNGSPDFPGASHRLAFSISPAASGLGTSPPLTMDTPMPSADTLPTRAELTGGSASRKRSTRPSGVLRLDDDDDSDTEHVHTEIRETSSSPVLKKMKKKREDSVRMLTTIFSGMDNPKEKPLRRKYPVFCATGVKPYIPAMSSSHQITHEDLQKEREATSAKLQSFLAKVEPEDSGTHLVSSGSSTKCDGRSASLTLPISKSTSGGTISAAAGGLGNALAQLATSVESGGLKQHVSKSVSFAPLLTQAMTSTLSGSLLTSTPASNGDANRTSLSTLTLQKPSLTTITSSTATLPSVTAGTSQLAPGSSSGLPGSSDSSLLQSSVKQASLSVGSLGAKLGEKDTQVTVPSSGLSLSSLPSSQQSLKFPLQGSSLSNTLASSASATAATSVSAQNSLPNLQSALLSLQSVASGLTSQTAQSSLPTFQNALSSLQASNSGPPKPAASQQNSLPTLQSALSSMQSSKFGALPSQSVAPTTTTSSLHPLANSSQFSFSATSTNASGSVSQSSSKLPLGTSAPSLNFQLTPASSQPAIALPTVTASTTSNPGLSGLLQGANKPNQSLVFQAPQAKPSLLQTSQQSLQQQQKSGLSSMIQASQVCQNTQASLFQSTPGTNQQPSLFPASTQASGQPSLFPASQASGSQSSLFSGAQVNKQPSLFQTSQPLQKMLPQSGSNSSPFQVSQASSQSSIFQVSQATAKPSLFQISQTAGQPSLFPASQSNTSNQSSLFQTSKPSLFGGSQSSSQPSLFPSTQPSMQASPFQAAMSQPSVFQSPSGLQFNSSQTFQTPQASNQPSSSTTFNFSAGASATQQPGQSQPNLFNAGKGSSFVFGTSQQQNSGNLFGKTPTATPSQSGFQFSAKPVQSTPAIPFGAHNASSNVSFNFGSQNATPTTNSGFVFGQATNTPPVVQFGGQQQPNAGGFNFQTPSAGVGNVFNFSKSTGPSTPTSSRPRNRGRSKRK